MKRFNLLSLVACTALTSSIMAADLALVSNLKIDGDARVRGLSTSGITKANAKDRETYDSRVRINLDSETKGGTKVHVRLVFDNDTWGNNNDDEFSWDEGTILVPLNSTSFAYLGRLNDTYATKFYGSHNDKIDLAFLGYTGIKDTLLYVFDFKAVEGAYNSDNGQLGVSTGDGDYDAYGIGGQVTIDELTIGGRYVSLQDNRSDDGGVTFRDTKGFFVDAFASGKIAGLELEAEVQQNGGDKHNGTTKSDLEAFGAYLKLAKSFGDFKVSGYAVMTEDGYVSGGDLEAAYLTNDDKGLATLGRVGGYGDTSLFSLQAEYNINSDLKIEGAVASYSIDKATINSFNKDLEITEFDVGLEYKINDETTYSLRYANGSFDDSSFEDISNVMHSIEVSF